MVGRSAPVRCRPNGGPVRSEVPPESLGSEVPPESQWQVSEASEVPVRPQ